jgi:hypothetical protein
MRVKILLASVAAALVVGMMPSPAMADGEGGSGAITANLTATGSRSVTVVTPIVFATGLGTALDGNYNVVVAEAGRTGTNPWSVTSRVCGADATGLVADCTNEGDRLESGANTLPGSAMTASARNAVIQVAGGGTSSPGTVGEDMSTSRTLFSNSGQNTGLLYTGTYTAGGTFSITPPQGQAAAIYTGYFVVTLVQ